MLIIVVTGNRKVIISKSAIYHITFWETFRSNDQFWEKFYLIIQVGWFDVVIISLWNVNLILPRMLCARCSWNWPSGYLNVFNVHFFAIFSPWRERGPSFWTILNFTTACCVSNVCWNHPSGFLNVVKLFRPLNVVNAFFLFPLIRKRMLPFIWM